jgi:hypothetical protein
MSMTFVTDAGNRVGPEIRGLRERNSPGDLPQDGHFKARCAGEYLRLRNAEVLRLAQDDNSEREIRDTTLEIEGDAAAQGAR